MNESPIDWLPEWLWSALAEVTDDAEIWLVGGAVRDKLIGVETKDFDFAVSGDARSIARKLANNLKGDYYALDEERGTGRSIVPRDHGAEFILDFASLRGDSIIEDLEGRDFTLNALAINLAEPGQIIDPLAGLQDLKDRSLRPCSPDAFDDDPIRTLRAARLAIQLEASIDSQTLAQIRKIKETFIEISAERVRDEIFRILSLTRPASALRLLDHFGLLEVVFPDLQSLRGKGRSTENSYDLLDHALAIVDHLSSFMAIIKNDQQKRNATDLVYAEFIYRLGGFRAQLNDFLDVQLSHGRSIRELLLLAALFHNVGKAENEESEQSPAYFASIAAQRISDRGFRLRLSKNEIQWLKQTIRNRDHPAQVSAQELVNPRNLYRSLSELDYSLPGITLLFLAELLAENDPPLDQDEWGRRIATARAFFDGYWHAAIDDLTKPALVRGDELNKILGIHPGPELGALLENLREAQYAGEIKSKQEAVALARKIYEGFVED